MANEIEEAENKVMNFFDEHGSRCIVKDSIDLCITVEQLYQIFRVRYELEHLDRGE